MKDLKIRCSCIGKIMTNDRSGKNIGKTAITYLEELLKENLYSRRKEFSNKYTDKGQIVEDNAIDLAIEHGEIDFNIKNDDQFENNHLTGTPDLIYPDLVVDIKSSWDCFTFPLFDEEIPTKDYFYQLQGYMALTNTKKAKLIYVLCDTPEFQIQKEALYTNKGQDPEEYYQECLERMTYSNIPLELRVKSFEIERDEEVIQSIYKRVEQCRELLSTYKIPEINDPIQN